MKSISFCVGVSIVLFCIHNSLYGAVCNEERDIFNLAFDVKAIPFSRFGSYMSIVESYDKNNNIKILDLNDLTGDVIWGDKCIMKIKPRCESFNSMNFIGTPTELCGVGNDSRMSIYYETPRILHCDVEDADLELYGGWGNDVFPLSGKYHNTYIIRNKNIALTIKRGNAVYDRDSFFVKKDFENKIEVVIEQYYSAFLPKRYTLSKEQCIDQLKLELKRWDTYMPEIDKDFFSGKCLASYLNWSCIYEPRGNITRYGMAMSKNRMIYIWSWDHCFNSLCLSYKNPRLSWDQFMLMFDHQDPETGAIPDLISSSTMVWRDKKPPIHGWILSELLKIYTPSIEEMEKAYLKLSNWTSFWVNYRDEDKNGLPHYYNGLDSGWDNGTAFDIGSPTEGADLSAFLILQMETLSELAGKLGKQKEAEDWECRSEAMLKMMVSELWNGEKFITRMVDSGKVNNQSKSLMSYLPLILGKRLPDKIMNKLIADIKQPGLFLTPFGLATESPSSTLYVSDGYWRGPIWAPTTLIIIYGLSECGEHELAADIAKRFCENCLLHGFAENYDALTGKPLRDYSYTWTSSVFMILAHKYLFNKK